MPYLSEKQRAYFNANRAKLERQGVDVDEWNRSSKGKKLPKRAAVGDVEDTYEERTFFDPLFTRAARSSYNLLSVADVVAKLNKTEGRPTALPILEGWDRAGPSAGFGFSGLDKPAVIKLLSDSDKITPAIALHESAHILDPQSYKFPQPATLAQMELPAMVTERVAENVYDKRRPTDPTGWDLAIDKHGPKFTGELQADLNVLRDWVREYRGDTTLGRLAKQWEKDRERSYADADAEAVHEGLDKEAPSPNVDAARAFLKRVGREPSSAYTRQKEFDKQQRETLDRLNDPGSEPVHSQSDISREAQNRHPFDWGHAARLASVALLAGGAVGVLWYLLRRKKLPRKPVRQLGEVAQPSQLDTLKQMLSTRLDKAATVVEPLHKTGQLSPAEQERYNKLRAESAQILGKVKPDAATRFVPIHRLEDTPAPSIGNHQDYKFGPGYQTNMKLLKDPGRLLTPAELSKMEREQHPVQKGPAPYQLPLVTNMSNGGPAPARPAVPDKQPYDWSRWGPIAGWTAAGGIGLYALWRLLNSGQEKEASVAGMVAPISTAMQDVVMFNKEPTQQKAKPTADRLADLVEAETELEEEKTRKRRSLSKDVGMGAVTGGLTLGTKGLMAAGANSAAAFSPLALGAVAGAGTGLATHLLRDLTRRKRLRNARKIVKDSFNFDRAILDDPASAKAVDRYRTGRWGPFIGLEGGALAGSTLGAMFGAHTTTPQAGDVPASVAGLDMPFTQRQAERMGWTGLAGGLAGGAAGLLAGLLYRRFRKGRLVKTLHDRLSKEASAWLRTNYPMTTNTSTGGKPISSSNRRLMLDQQPEYFSAGYIVDRGGRKLAQDMLPGGDADHADISKLPADQVLKGSVHETEHTKDPGLAVEIASDHVVEDPKYYDKLEKMEKEAGLINTSVMQRGVAQMLANLQKKPLAVPKPAKIAPITVPGTRATDTAAHMPSTVTNVERRLNPTVPTMWKGDIGATPKVTPPPGWNQLQDMRPSVLSALRGGRVTIGPMAEINESNRLLRGLAQRQERALTGVRPPVSAGPIPISPTSRLGQNMQQQAVSMNREQLLAALNRMERQNSPQALARTQQAAQQARQGALRGLGTAAGVVGATGAAASQVEAPGSQPAQSSTVQIAQPEQIQLPEGEPIQWAGSYSQPDNRKVAQVNDSGLILRERAEVIITSPDGVLAIKKPDYLLLPGGGLNEEETPQMAAIRETIEEADLLLEDPKPEGEVRVAYAGEGPSPGFNGELTHFFTSTAGEPLGVDHEDREDFTYIPFEEALIHLTECMLDEKNDWARDNNLKRAQLIERAMKEQAGVDKDLQEAEIVRADKIEKTADVPVLMPRSEYVLFNKDGKLVLRRRENRRFELPTQGVGRPAPYEPRIRYMPPEGVPEQGVHGYEVGLNVGEADQIPEGYEAVDPQAALKDLYASMGLKTNLPHQAIDRARSRVILRELKKRNKPAGVQNAA